MTTTDLLTVAAALAHSVPGAELRLRCAAGGAVVVGTRPDAGLSPCALRGIIVGARAGERPEPLQGVVGIELGGALDDVGGGVVRTRTRCGIEQRWIACRLPPAPVLAMLDEVDGDGLLTDSVHGRLTVDRGLGVAVLVLTAERSGLDAVLDAAAVGVAASWFAAELIHGVTGGVNWMPR